jgi:hypothetical protein
VELISALPLTQTTHLKDAEEEGAEVVKHFRKEIPPHAGVWREV